MVNETRFKSPRRRLTRQRSGFKVSGDKKGSTCKIKRSKRLDIKEKSFELIFKEEKLKPILLFQKDKGIIGFGGYINPKVDLEANLEISVKLDKVEHSDSWKFDIKKENWNKVGILLELNLNDKSEIKDIKGILRLRSKTQKIKEVDFFGFNLGMLNFEYFKENDVEDIFYEKLPIYLPEIFYFNFDESFVVKPMNVSLSRFKDGKTLILKSCNRCSRYLLIDFENERNTVSFSNHCFKQAPCTHKSFSDYSITESDYPNLPDIIQSKLDKERLKMYYGFQLECKSCKKFFVNAPLNPLRNSTQHREDSLRRRAIEILVDTLLELDWIYHKFRMKNKKEFDTYIWNKFGRKCFKCRINLKSPNQMDLDHTMPLSAFWPLDETATCLCKKCNSLKSDAFPISFYTQKELKDLAKITGLDIEFLKSKSVNVKVIEKMVEKIIWFFDEFLANKDYQKIRGGKRTSDLIFKAIEKQVKRVDKNLDLVKIYEKKTKRKPKTITL